MASFAQAENNLMIPIKYKADILIRRALRAEKVKQRTPLIEEQWAQIGYLTRCLEKRVRWLEDNDGPADELAFARELLTDAREAIANRDRGMDSPAPLDR